MPTGAHVLEPHAVSRTVGVGQYFLAVKTVIMAIVIKLVLVDRFAPPLISRYTAMFSAVPDECRKKYSPPGLDNYTELLYIRIFIYHFHLSVC